VTLVRRLSALESDLDPTARVVGWLEEAHAYDSLERYAAAIIERPDLLPLNCLPREAIAVIRARRGARTSDIDEEVRETLRSIVFRVYLVLGMAERTTAVLDREGLVSALLAAHLALAAEFHDRIDRPVLPADRCRDLLLERVLSLLALAAAHRCVEARYLGGRTALFPETARLWTEQVAESQTLAAMAIRLAELDGYAPIDEDLQLVPSQARIEASIADLVEVARIKTLDDIGEGQAAIDRMRRWFASKPAHHKRSGLAWTPAINSARKRSAGAGVSPRACSAKAGASAPSAPLDVVDEGAADGHVVSEND
jgi:hypothetical protein